MSFLGKKFGPKIASYLKNKGIKTSMEIAQSKAAKVAAKKRAVEAAAARQAAQARQVRQNIKRYGSGDRPNTGMNAPGAGKGQSPTGGDVAGTPFVRGGRVSYFDGGLLSLWQK